MKLNYIKLYLYFAYILIFLVGVIYIIERLRMDLNTLEVVFWGSLLFIFAGHICNFIIGILNRFFTNNDKGGVQKNNVSKRK